MSTEKTVHSTASPPIDPDPDTHPSVTPSPERYLLRLYITGLTPKSVQAIANLKRICAEHLEGRYTLETIDLYQQPERAREAQIIAAPTLVKELPSPLRRIIGDLANQERVLVALDLRRQ
jgi:circadian clock protein KaiB